MLSARQMALGGQHTYSCLGTVGKAVTGLRHGRKTCCTCVTIVFIHTYLGGGGVREGGRGA